MSAVGVVKTMRNPSAKRGFCSFPPPSFCRLGRRMFAVAQVSGHDYAVENPDGAEDVEGVAPAPEFADDAGDIPAEDDPDIISRLVDRHGEGSRPVVVIGDERVVRRPEEGFAAARCDAAHHDQHQESVAESREHGGDAPEEDARRHDPLAAETVADKSSDRDQHGIEQVESRGDRTDGHIAQPQVLADERKHHVEYLSVRLIEQVGDPQQGQHLPFVSFTDFVVSCHKLETLLSRFGK